MGLSLLISSPAHFGMKSSGVDCGSLLQGPHGKRCLKVYSLHGLRSMGFLTKVNLILYKWLNGPSFDMHQAFIVNGHYAKYE